MQDQFKVEVTLHTGETFNLPLVARGTEHTYSRFIEFSRFNAGERHVRVNLPLESLEKVKVTSLVAVPDIMDLLLLCNAIDNLPTVVINTIEVEMDYLPYGRQDRICNEGEANSLQFLLRILKNAGVDILVTLDAHTKDLQGLAPNSLTIRDRFAESIKYYVKELGLGEFDYIIAPDKGAGKRATIVANALGLADSRVMHMSKGRLNDGTITYQAKRRIPKGSNVLVVDDICDGGGTFLALADALPDDIFLNLYVTHGIFANNALEKLSERYVEIFSTKRY